MSFGSLFLAGNAISINNIPENVTRYTDFFISYMTSMCNAIMFTGNDVQICEYVARTTIKTSLKLK